MKNLLLSALILGLAAVTYAETADEAAVRAAHERFVTAAKAGDRATLDKLLADGVQYSHSSAKLETKKEAVDALVKSPTNFEVQNQTIHAYGNTATIRAKVVAHTANGDIPLSMLQVWVKKGKDWQLVERQTTRLPAQ